MKEPKPRSSRFVWEPRDLIVIRDGKVLDLDKPEDKSES